MLEDIRAQLRRMANPELVLIHEWYFREPIECYGIKAPVVRALGREIAQRLRVQGGFEAALLIAEELFQSRVLEEAILGEQVLSALGKAITAEHFDVFDRWVDYLTNWANTDGFALRLVGITVVRDEGKIRRLVPWTISENRWRRRAAAVGLIALARKGRAVDQSLDIAGRLMEDGDDMVQKGVGWLLKEIATKNSDKVVIFLIDWRGRTSQLVMQIASQKMPLEIRNLVLGM